MMLGVLSRKLLFTILRVCRLLERIRITGAHEFCTQWKPGPFSSNEPGYEVHSSNTSISLVDGSQSQWVRLLYSLQGRDYTHS